MNNTRWTESNRYAIYNQKKNPHTPHYDMPMTDNRLAVCMYECECLSASSVTQHKRNMYSIGVFEGGAFRLYSFNGYLGEKVIFNGFVARIRFDAQTIFCFTRC